MFTAEKAVKNNLLEIRWILAIFLLGINNFCHSQKYDRNWVFGTNAGIDFNDLDSVKTFRTSVSSNELTGSVSDSNGKLIFYLSTSSTFLAEILDQDGLIISGGDSIKAFYSSSSGAVILPSYDSKRFLIFHLSHDDLASCNLFCVRLYLTIVKVDGGVLTVETKNRLLLNQKLFEKLTAVKQGNGKDWWVVVNTQVGTSINRFYRFGVSDTSVKGPFYQDIGSPTFDTGNRLGQMKISHGGNLLALNKYESKVTDVFDFDRCSGTLSNLRSFGTGSKGAYGLEFSKNERFLYLTIGWLEYVSELLQVDLSNSVPSPIRVGQDSSTFFQLQLAPDEKIYLANQCSPGFPRDVYSICSQYISIINQPDSLACDFQLHSLYLGDSIKSTAGLPNMPNYNLGALSIYQADAGGEKTLCTEDTLVKGFFLGVPPVSGVTYSWYPSDSLSDTNNARPFANPSQSTMYVVTLTDTSIKYSCQSREDTVWVIVKDCSVGIDEFDLQSQVNIYPNPANEMLYISLPPSYSLQSIHLTDLNGKTILQTRETTIPLKSIAKGLYFVSVHLTNGESVVRKVVVE